MPPSGDNNPITVGIKELKKALWNQGFREMFPELKTQINTFLSNPNCKCNEPLYNTLLTAKDRLEKYFGGPVKLTSQPVTKESLKSKIHVINTTKDLLESELRSLPVGPKHISLARYEDKITAVVQLLT